MHFILFVCHLVTLNGCQATMTFNNHHLAIKMLTKEFTAYSSVFRKYMAFYHTYSRTFEDFLSAVDALSNT